MAHVVVGGDLHDAERRAIGALPDELGVERERGRPHGTRSARATSSARVGQEREASRARCGPSYPAGPSLATCDGAGPRVSTRRRGGPASPLDHGRADDRRLPAGAARLARGQRPRPSSGPRTPPGCPRRSASAACAPGSGRSPRRAGSASTGRAEFGGRDAGIPEQIAYVEEMARARAPEVIGNLGIGIAGPPIIAYGTEEQKRRFLPRILVRERPLVLRVLGARRRLRPGVAAHPGRRSTATTSS